MPEPTVTGPRGPVARPVLVGCSHGTDSVTGRAAIASILDGVRAARPDLDVREAFVDVQTPEVADVVAGRADRRGRGRRRAAAAVRRLPRARRHRRRGRAGRRGGVRRRWVRTRASSPSSSTGSPRRGRGPATPSCSPRPGRATRVPRTPSRRSPAGCGPRGRTARSRSGYGAGAQPSVPDAVAAARAGAHAGVVVASYLLAPGFFHDRLLTAGADVVTAPLAPDDRLAELVLDRYREGADRLAAEGAGVPRA